MTSSTMRTVRGRLRLRPRALLLILLSFTAFAVAGYAVFGLHPAMLQHVPGVASLYGQAFIFFARGHVWLAWAVLAVYLAQRVGWRWLPAFAAVYAGSLTSELLGTGYGLPFGGYHYTELLGFRWLDRVPWLIPLSWFSMAVPAYVLARHRFPEGRRRTARVLSAALLLLIWDLALDPAMSYLTSYWVWDEPGAYYGMPLINLGGWYLTGVVLMALMELLGAGTWARRTSPRWMAAYYGVVLLMPLGMVLAAGLWGAVLATTVALGVVGRLFAGRSPGTGALASVPDGDGVRADGVPVVPPAADPAGAFFGNHSRSFAFAARLLPRQQRRLVGALYAFCRTTDDLVDQRTGSAPADVERELDAWLARAEAAYEGRPSGLPWLDELMRASREAGVPVSLMHQLAEGVRMDVGPVAIASVDDLDRYTYRVASVVGVWMCYLFGVRDEDVLRRAAAMGRAMQLTNILRDVGEDLQHDRIYLPASLMARHGVSRAELYAMAAGGEITRAYRALIRELAARAEAEYDYAFPGLAALPPAFARASAVAAAVYRGIYAEIVRNGFDNLRRRAYTRPARKVVLAAEGLRRLRRLRRGAAAAPVPAPAAQPARERVGSLYLWFVLPLGLAAAILSPGGAARAGARPSGPHAEVHAAPADASWLGRLRDYYVRAVEDASVLEEGLAAVAAEGRRDPLTRAYAAALVVLRAKHAAWPHRKLHHLREGLGPLDELVREHPSDVEIRYLRLLSCYFLPSFLGRGWSVEQDFAALGRTLPEAAGRFPPALYRQMASFVLQHGAIAPAERASLSARLGEAAPAGDAP